MPNPHPNQGQIGAIGGPGQCTIQGHKRVLLRIGPHLVC